MGRHFIAALAALLAAGLTGAWGQDSQGGLLVRAVRFYSRDSKQTRVKAFAQIPYSLFQPTNASPSAQLSFLVTFRVSDSTGKMLYQEPSWRSRVPAGLRNTDAYGVETVDFAVAPGKYRLDVTVEDSMSSNKGSAGVDLEGFADSPPASDLLLAARMRLIGSADSAQPGEFPRGKTLITAAAAVVLTPLRPKMFYLLEAYTEQPDSGNMAISVLDSVGKAVVDVPAKPVTVGAGGGVLKGQVDLSGLPPGRYTMTVSLDLAGRNTQRSAPFIMAGLDETLRREQARLVAERVTDEGYFAAMSQEELDAAKAPLVYLAENQDNLGLYDELGLSAKRRFLAEFWKRRDPDPATPANERRNAFYEAIEFANRTYREGGRRPQAGWRSDRGRIYALNGPPDDVFSRQQEGRAPPYQIWRYTRGRNRYYIFADRTGFGAYNMIASNDLRQPSMPDWRDILGWDAVVDASRYLGVDLYGEPRTDMRN